MKKKQNNAKLSLKKIAIAPLNTNSQEAINGGAVSIKCQTIHNITCIDCVPSFSGCPITWNCA
ncbi:MAG TPA: class I lanthipeptide [Chitinophaga sp.]|uniref:class I lanthipeptide n=1 Tax=Chitinophaga sp. TaxID=1869181 RepID=UPI002C9889C5|nr:class I lanthipeptide [Chitinophaga sp.]HVI46338.1 class I lanthipeptide [Chitinophaga sp.]